MTQEEKDLLLKDICARLPYGVKCKYYNCCEGDYDEGTICGFERQEYIQIDGVCICIEEVKPYLFPLSSMTEEQEKEFKDLFYRFDRSAFIFNERFSYDRYSIKDIGFYPCYLQDWLNKNHFDYRGLIPMGSAIDATDKNIY